MARNPNRVVDKKCIDLDAADERIIRHRDVTAHAFRWSHIARYLVNLVADSAYWLGFLIGRLVGLLKDLTGKKK